MFHQRKLPKLLRHLCTLMLMLIFLSLVPASESILLAKVSPKSAMVDLALDNQAGWPRLQPGASCPPGPPSLVQFSTKLLEAPVHRKIYSSD